MYLRSQFKKENAIINILVKSYLSQKYRRKWKPDGIGRTNSNNVKKWFHNYCELHVLSCQFSVNLRLTRYWLIYKGKTVRLSGTWL